MSNRDLDKWLAENVMGWVDDHIDKEGDWRDEYDEYTGFTVKDWHPTESKPDAIMVVEKMRSEGYLVELKGYSDGWRVWINSPAAGGYGEFNSSLSLAICLAARRAFEK